MVNIAHVNREIKRVVSSLRITYIYAVKKYGNLLKIAAAYAYIGLRAHGTTLAYIYTCSIFEYVVDRLHGVCADFIGSHDIGYTDGIG